MVAETVGTSVMCTYLTPRNVIRPLAQVVKSVMASEGLRWIWISPKTLIYLLTKLRQSQNNTKRHRSNFASVVHRRGTHGVQPD
ncbi:hypothetical protein MPTK1_5g14560 [Marchantia polymorpha subsp. ruderalis]|uniref:Uncharacterized protein n=2 Tax=Marchantia polymorpha TaxID=3197 RepID=A0AAF6BID4_MARPO|nr:hypothetical protein MARPO_0032s0148 [Marchantia polymorpha]BBN11768.1 hypothetical protein Mp_5g14560 [Marchantia polymorpha subsp. ruderalis]|eukprot:PTQ41986.1 hypothetical protein MARPO_0032s0148 [Marchantia polymorpha]